METQWQLLLAPLLEADQSHRSVDSHLLTAHQLKCFRKKSLLSSQTVFHCLLFCLFYSPCFVWWSHLFPFRLFTCSATPLPSHSLSDRCFGAVCQWWESKTLKAMYMSLCEIHSDERERPQSGFNRQKNKVASFHSVRAHDSLWVTWGNSSLSVYW